MRKYLLCLSVVVATCAAGLFHVSPAFASGPAVAVCATIGEETQVQSALVGSGRFSTVDTLNCQGSTPSLATLQQYVAVFAWPNGSYADFSTLSQVLAQYVDGGGRLVLGQWGFESCCGTWWGTTLDTGGYLPFTNASGNSGGSIISVHSMAFDIPSSPLLGGVSVVGTNVAVAALVGLAPGATQIAHWDDGPATPAIATKGNVVGLNLWFNGTSFSASGDWLALLGNALLASWSVAPSGPASSPSHAGYCSVAGNVNAFTGVSIQAGTFLNLDVGQAADDPSYQGAVPANFVEGSGISCDPPPIGYVLHGFASDTDNVAGGFYPYFAKPTA